MYDDSKEKVVKRIKVTTGLGLFVKLPAGCGTLIEKQGGGHQGRLPSRVNARHAESGKKINDEIQGIEDSLVERIKNGGLGKEDSGVAGKIDPLSNPKIAKEIEANSDAVYGYSHKQGLPIDKF
ncbi:hypothetical protein COE80_30650 [Bacillus pseudomycoides]|uniref:hypothetical protein n=1 Tax=Bacillus pseudomycoides TaxID=64104 RepID=UPI000BF3E5E2|nr:hypothetical protein [Bacillus pseudomycoides]PGE98011.1 hypothetical protein COM62_06705 [Bacillus pseudomycoides]PHB12352.1 hypothetical protein COE80_30650 [Bacillus pseudomycoides]PHE27177.1 hypothetical protein COF51_29690 [Bacillus pseudomycoides]